MSNNRAGCRFYALMLALIVFQSSAATAKPASSQADCVILLHGLARTSASMEKMEDALTSDGYFVVNDSYPSRHNTIQVLAPLAIDAGLENCGELPEDRQVHFVTHSLGGILVRYYFADRQFPNLGRIVMLAPPNQGSAAADRLGWLPGINQINGPAGKQLGKGSDSVPLDLGIPEFEFAVIAGDRSIDPVSSAVLANPDDGKVSVADTKLEGMADFALIHVSHAFIMKDKEVIELVLNFLKNGRFGEQQP